MSVIRIEKTKDYTVMSNYHFKEKEMSLKAKGLLSLMLSLPEKWDYSIAGLVAICKENETSIKTALDELKEFGYLQVIKKLPNETKTGRIEYEYIVYEQKIHKINTENIEVKVGKELLQELEKQDLENLGVEVQGVEKPIQYNNKQLNTKDKNKDNKVSKKDSSYDVIICEGITDEEVRQTLRDFIKMRTMIKKPMTDRALRLLISKLHRLANTPKMAVKILERSILNNWQDIYEIKENKKSNETYEEHLQQMYDSVMNTDYGD